MTRSLPEISPPSSPLFLAGHRALDFLNSRMRLKGELVDFFQRDQDVLRWLRLAGFSAPAKAPALEPSSALLHAARKLRENVRGLVEARKAGHKGNVALLNSFLAGAPSHPRVVWNAPRSVRVDRVRTLDTAEAILAPVAEAAADFLATADFALVKRCEDETCVFWFVDQTKSHHRRWCSMALCGNRNKVAAYRKRARRK